MRLNGGYIAFWLVLLTNVAAGHDLKSNNAGSSFVFNQGEDTADAAQDAKMTDLTDSIQGLFGDAPAQPVASSKASQPKATEKVAAKASSPKAAPVAKAPVPKRVVATKTAKTVELKVVKAVAPKPEVKAVSTKPSAVIAAVASKAQRPQLAQTISKPLQVKTPEVAKPVKAKKQSVTHKAPETKVVDKKSQVAPPQVVTKPAKTQVKIVAQSKTQKVNKAPTKPTQPKIEKKVAKVEEAKHVALAAKSPEPVPTKPTAKAQTPEKTSQPNTGVAATKLQAAQTAKAVVKKVVSHTSNLKAGLANLSNAINTAKATPAMESNATLAKAINATQAKESNTTLAKESNTTEKAAVSLKESNSTQETENKTKEIEEAVVSLPMASLFADEPPKPVANKTEKKFPGNASQKAAWETKEKALEDEVLALKARLANTNRSEPMEAKVTETVSGNGSKAFMAAKLPVETKKSNVAPPKKATKPLTDYHAGDVTDGTVTNVMFKRIWVNIGAGEDASFMNNDKGVKYKVGDHLELPVQSVDLVTGHVHLQAPPTKATELRTSSGTSLAPVKKVQSVLAVDAKVEEQAMVTDHDASTADATPDSAVTVVDDAQASSSTPTPSSWWGWISSFFSSSAAVSDKPAAPALRKSSLLQSFTRTHQPGHWKQDALRTAEAAKEESEHVIQVNDAWSQMEQDDSVKEDLVRREDEAERERAETPEQPHKPRKNELQGRHGVDMSGFWGRLEKEDYGIEHSVDTEDLGEYERLTQAQNSQVESAAKQVENNHLIPERAALKHNDDQRLPIHEPWLRKENRDIDLEKKIHDSPELQMIQLQHHHSRK
jgi:hypothetical protein